MIRGKSITNNNKVIIYLSVFFVLFMVVAGSWFFWPRTPRLERYQAMFFQGKYDACRTDLTRLLENDPQWLGARELLLRVELADGKPLAAIPHFFILLEAGVDLTHHERTLASVIQQNPALVEEISQALRAALVQRPGFIPSIRLLARVELAGGQMVRALEQMIVLAERSKPDDELDASLIRTALHPGNSDAIATCLELLATAATGLGQWPARLGLELALAAGEPIFIARALELLPTCPVSLTELDSLVRRAWQNLLTADILEPLVPLSLHLEPRYGRELAAKLTQLPTPDLEDMLALYPNNPLLLLQQGINLSMAGRVQEALSLILAAEADHPDQDFATGAKHEVLLLWAPASLEEGHVRNLSNVQLVELALAWQGAWPQAAREVVELLAQDPAWQRQANFLRALDNPPPAPNPHFTFRLPQGGIYRALPSPDGERIMFLLGEADGSKTHWLIADVKNRTISKLQSAEGPCQAYWAPNSQRLLLINRSSASGQGWVINAARSTAFRISIPGQILGWRDNEFVVAVGENSILAFNTGTPSSIILKDNITGIPMLTQRGELWFIQETSDRVALTATTRTHHLPREYKLTSPLPGSIGAGGYHHSLGPNVHLAWVFDRNPATPLEMPGMTVLWNRPAGEGYVWAILNLPGQPQRLARLDFLTLTPDITGITGEQVTAGNALAVAITGQTVTVYTIP
jgi:tetratricopeptide (TPR) repeat protein